MLDWQNFKRKDINLFAGVVTTSIVYWRLLFCSVPDGLSDGRHPETKSQLNGRCKAMVVRNEWDEKDLTSDLRDSREQGNC